MMELCHAKGSTYYFQSPSKVGLVEIGEGRAVLIDSGSDRDAAKRIRRTLEERGLSLTAIYNTHSHGDHIGGNKYLQDNTGCRIYAPPIDCCFTNHPVLEPSLLFSATPPAPLRHKFFMAGESKAELLTATALPAGFSVVDLGGHSPSMMGIRTPDDVLFVGDAVASAETLAKYRVTYTYDVARYLDTLARLRGVQAALFIPAHAAPTEDLSELLALNEAAVLGVGNDIVELCRTPMTHEMLLKALFDRYGLTLTFGQFALVGATLRAYLTWLLDTGCLTFEVADNYLYYKAVKESL